MIEGQFAQLAVPGVVLLISFLSYASQYLFTRIEPGSLEQGQAIIFNLLLACLWVSYARTCRTDPGRVPLSSNVEKEISIKSKPGSDEEQSANRQRYCRKCKALKPPRAHHCRVCRRCIPKMDHHCPWTANCVSHFTMPHFMRFNFYAVSSMIYLEYFLYVRAAVIWQNRHLPSYLGPSIGELVHLFLLIMVNSLTLFLVLIILLRSIWSLGGNVTTIESWEIERHQQLLRRARVFGGYLDGPDGIKVRIVKQEFPYDIGIWSNIVQGMGTANILAWFWPLSATPRTDGLTFETNGFEDPNTTWPPPDPDRMPRMPRERIPQKDAFVYSQSQLSDYDEVQAFKSRQQADYQQRFGNGHVQRRKAFHQRFEDETDEPIDHDYFEEEEADDSGEEGWQDSGGNRLKDYGVDEEVEFYDEDDIPLAELLKRRGLQSSRKDT